MRTTTIQCSCLLWNHMEWHSIRCMSVSLVYYGASLCIGELIFIFGLKEWYGQKKSWTLLPRFRRFFFYVHNTHTLAVNLARIHVQTICICVCGCVCVNIFSRTLPLLLLSVLVTYEQYSFAEYVNCKWTNTAIGDQLVL